MGLISTQLQILEDPRLCTIHFVPLSVTEEKQLSRSYTSILLKIVKNDSKRLNYQNGKGINFDMKK